MNLLRVSNALLRAVKQVKHVKQPFLRNVKHLPLIKEIPLNLNGHKMDLSDFVKPFQGKSWFC